MTRQRFVLALVALLTSVCGPPPATQNPLAPPFDLQNLAGGRTTLASFQGKVVVVDFWATWCPPCLKELPEYATFYAMNKTRGVEMVGLIFASGAPDEMRDFVQKAKVSYPQLVGDDALLDSYDANTGYPTTFVIGKRGEIVKKVVGSPAGKFEILQKAVDRALGAT